MDPVVAVCRSRTRTGACGRSLVWAALALAGILAGGCAASPQPAGVAPTAAAAPLETTLPAVSPAPLTVTAAAATARPSSPAYAEYRSEHFRILYTGPISATQVLTVSRYLEAAWQDVPALLQRAPPPAPVRVYLQDDAGSAGSGSPSGEIFISQGALAQDYSGIPHEFAHTLLGSKSGWMAEGVAIYAEERCPAGTYRNLVSTFAADSWCAGLLDAGQLVTLQDLPASGPRPQATDDPEQAFAELRGYWESASFDQFLIERYGLAKFWELYDGPLGWWGAEQVYGQPYQALFAAWQEHLAAVTIPEHDCPPCIRSFFAWLDTSSQLYQRRDTLPHDTRARAQEEMAAVGAALAARDAAAMQTHLAAARALLDRH